MRLIASERFLRDRRKASPDMGARIDRELCHLEERMSALPTRWYENYTIRKGTVVDVAIHEIEVGRSYRILTARFSPDETCLLMCGEHDNVYGEWDRSQRKILDAATRRKLPYSPAVSDAPPVLDIPAIRHRWEEERFDEWAYFLSDEQMTVVDAIGESIADAMVSGTPRTHVVIGGPGTGKTAILMKLIEQTADLDADFPVGLRCTARLADYLAARTPLPIAAVRAAEDPRILFVDDPSDLSEALDARNGTALVNVVVFDPLQLDRLPGDSELDALLALPDVSDWVLRDCYRQKEEAGKQALALSRQIAASSPYANASRVRDKHERHQRVHEYALSMEFTNPSGYFIAPEKTSRSAVAAHVDWVLQQNPRQTGWPDVAIVVGQDVALSDKVIAELSELYADQVAEWQITSLLKGLDYNHVIVFLAPEAWDGAFKGFQASGERKYDQWRKLRIPFSRARDSLAVFRA